MRKLFTALALIFAPTALVVPQSLTLGGGAKIGGQSVVRRAAGGGCPSVTATWSDNFNSGRDACIWDSVDYTSGPTAPTIAFTSSELQITVLGTLAGNSEAGPVTKDSRDFTGRFFAAQILTSPLNTGRSAIMYLVCGSGNLFILSSSNASTTVGSWVQIAGGTTIDSGGFDLNSYWRVRHNAGDDRFKVESSADGSSWSGVFGDSARGFTITACKQYLVAAGDTQATSNQTIRFDNASVQ